MRWYQVSGGGGRGGTCPGTKRSNKIAQCFVCTQQIIIKTHIKGSSPLPRIQSRDADANATLRLDADVIWLYRHKQIINKIGCKCSCQPAAAAHVPFRYVRDATYIAPT